jgi:hypothetical protein
MSQGISGPNRRQVTDAIGLGSGRDREASNQLCRDTTRANRDPQNPLHDFATAASCFSRQRSYVRVCIPRGLSGNSKPNRSPPNRTWIFCAII